MFKKKISVCFVLGFLPVLLGEEVSQLQKALRDFTCDLTQAQSQLEATQREKSVLLSKSLELEKMHVQMKEHMGADIHYLRQLNLQLVERQVKGEGERGNSEEVCRWVELSVECGT